METTKLSKDDCITFTYNDNGVEVSIKYSRYSTLKKRYEVLDKFKEIIMKI